MPTFVWSSAPSHLTSCRSQRECSRRRNRGSPSDPVAGDESKELQLFTLSITDGGHSRYKELGLMPTTISNPAPPGSDLAISSRPPRQVYTPSDSGRRANDGAMGDSRGRRARDWVKGDSRGRRACDSAVSGSRGRRAPNVGDGLVGAIGRGKERWRGGRG
ncbi:hypothetical protein TIFTF001_001487 [Ficus carica]|uniref:Uncharacterized protein n=1 Tax=Ficus carica TaxID=3494 RepID=A0AA88CM57_FICCA|nr:hypothetical protein TIFTF001_001487 [Ficus carica]